MFLDIFIHIHGQFQPFTDAEKSGNKVPRIPHVSFDGAPPSETPRLRIDEATTQCWPGLLTPQPGICSPRPTSLGPERLCQRHACSAAQTAAWNLPVCTLWDPLRTKFPPARYFKPCTHTLAKNVIFFYYENPLWKADTALGPMDYWGNWV
jgi:hypothetical protein